MAGEERWKGGVDLFDGENTRAWTMWAALVRSQVFSQDALESQQKPKVGTLCLHVVGADAVEANESAMQRFAPLAELVASKTNYGTLRILLVGPNVPFNEAGRYLEKVYGDLTVKIAMESLEYHESKLAQEEFSEPALAFLFNAGIWGYDSWKPTLQLLHSRRTTVVVTSYNQWEAEDDSETVAEVAPFVWLWEAEENPFRSAHHRPSGIADRTCCENHHWQCFLADSM